MLKLKLVSVVLGITLPTKMYLPPKEGAEKDIL